MDKILSLLGIGKRGGFVRSGEFQTEKSVKEQKACIVLLAEDASGNTKKKFYDSCAFYGIGIWEYGTKAALGTATGTEERAVLAVEDFGIAGAIKKLLTKD